MDRRTFLASTSFGLAADVTVTCAARVDSARTTDRREMVIAQAGEPHSFDPHASKISNDSRVVFNLFDTLICRHPDGTMHPALATAWVRCIPGRAYLWQRVPCRS